MARFTTSVHALTAALLAMLCAACAPAPSTPATAAGGVTPTPLPHASGPPPSGAVPPHPTALSRPRALAGDCNTTSWTWPFCDIPWPSIPRFRVGGGRPDLTPKESAWCRSTYIKGGGNSGYTYWILTQNTKHQLRFWPDYYSRYYQAVYWDGRAWQWLPVNRSYPNVIMGQRVYCDA